MYIKKRVVKSFIFSFLLLSAVPFVGAQASIRTFDQFVAVPPIKEYGKATPVPKGLTPTEVKTAYHLPQTGGKGTIAIITAFDAPSIEKDLEVFSKQFSLPVCSADFQCFEKRLIDKNTKKTDQGWQLEAALDVEWAHAIAPEAKILLVEAKNDSGPELLKAIDYARHRDDVVAISMSWGGPEFKKQTDLNGHFLSDHQIAFVAASGDSGNGVSWPSVSSNVIAVGGSSFVDLNQFRNSLDQKALTISATSTANTKIIKEVAWKGSGGGISMYEPQPPYQNGYSIPQARGKRAVPDVSYNADPKTGYAVYHLNSTVSTSSMGWHMVGGTSAGAPQWAAIKALGSGVSNKNFYNDKASNQHTLYFRDITSGSNGSCGFLCSARKRYDYVTGLGSPVTDHF